MFFLAFLEVKKTDWEFHRSYIKQQSCKVSNCVPLFESQLVSLSRNIYQYNTNGTSSEFIFCTKYFRDVSGKACVLNMVINKINTIITAIATVITISLNPCSQRDLKKIPLDHFFFFFALTSYFPNTWKPYFSLDALI